MEILKKQERKPCWYLKVAACSNGTKCKSHRQECAQQVEEQCGIQCEGKEMDMSKNRQRGSQRGSRGQITEDTGRHCKHSGCSFKPKEESLESLHDMTQPDLTFRTHSSCPVGNRP